jgi:hypothetical protein
MRMVAEEIVKEAACQKEGWILEGQVLGFDGVQVRTMPNTKYQEPVLIVA